MKLGDSSGIRGGNPQAIPTENVTRIPGALPKSNNCRNAILIRVSEGIPARTSGGTPREIPRGIRAEIYGRITAEISSRNASGFPATIPR